MLNKIKTIAVLTIIFSVNRGQDFRVNYSGNNLNYHSVVKFNDSLLSLFTDTNNLIIKEKKILQEMEIFLECKS